jgi:hypothetical protein
MESRRGRGIACMVAVLLGVTGPGLTGRASAECLAVEVRVWTEGSSTPSYPAGLGPKKCLLATGWGPVVVGGDQRQQGVVPTGYPDGAGLTLWVPVP